MDLIKKPEPKDKVPRIFPAVSGGSSGPTDVRLNAIGPVVGIDALNPNKPLTFGDGNLSVIYGANGSGKSGYARILNRACGKSQDVDLKRNIFKAPPSERKCTFKYSIAGKEKECDWLANADPVDDLKLVDIFDSERGRIYLEKDTRLSYEPPELALFADIVKACKLVETALSSEQEKLACKLPEIPRQHAATAAGKAYASVSKDTSTDKLAELVAWTAAHETALTDQRARLKVADPVAAAAKKRKVQKQIEAIRDTLQKGMDALRSENINELLRLKAVATSARAAAKEGAQAMGSAAKLEGIGSETWRAMWEASRAYSTTEAYPDSLFPNTAEGVRCVLCHQNLDDEAKRRLDGFEDFVKGALEAAAAKAEKSWKESLEVLPVRPTPDALATECQAAEFSEEVQAGLESIWATLEAFVAPLREGDVTTSPPELKGAFDLMATLETLAEAAESAAKDLESDATSPDRSEARANVVELEGTKWVTEQATAVQAEIDRLKKWAEYEAWKRKTTTTGISRKAGELSEVLITESYVQRFNDELTNLGAHKIQVVLVKTATSYGKSKHGVRLRDSTDGSARVAEILSEGERRIVALAAFLADVTGRRSNAPFVFDDPISSLNQFFEEKVVGRLVKLSKDRQVLVFTHRLSFLGIMNDVANDGLHDVHIRREPWGTGQPSEIPLFGKRPDKALNNLKGDRLPKARKAYDNDGYDAYSPLAKAICTDFRILMERIVETVFLADVVQRHRRAVNTMGKIGNLVKIEKSDCDLIDEMMTRYSRYEHSQSDEAPVEVPEPDEIEKDISRMVDWHREFTQK